MQSTILFKCSKYVILRGLFENYDGVARPDESVRTGSADRAISTLESQYMYTVYVLQDEKGKLYKGCTNNLARRFSEHVSGNTRTTRLMSGLKIVYTEEYETFGEARLREKYLKSSAGRRYLKKKMTG